MHPVSRTSVFIENCEDVLKLLSTIKNACNMYTNHCEEGAFSSFSVFSPQIQKEVEAELDRLVGQEGAIHTKMLALQRMGYSLF